MDMLNWVKKIQRRHVVGVGTKNAKCFWHQYLREYDRLVGEIQPLG